MQKEKGGSRYLAVSGVIDDLPRRGISHAGGKDSRGDGIRDDAAQGMAPTVACGERDRPEESCPQAHAKSLPV